VRPYLYETLLFLVEVHAHVSSAARSQLERTLNALVEEIAEEALRCFRQVKRFGMGGMLRATLEIEFLHQTLSRFVTPTAAKTLAEVYNKISQAYVSRKGDEPLQAHLDGVKKTLADTRRSTGIEFLCFRATKDKSAPKSASSSVKDGENTPRATTPTASTPRTRETEPTPRRRRVGDGTSRGGDASTRSSENRL